MVILKANGITCTRDGGQLFAPLTFDVRGGESVGIVGPNGIGKSTLLDTLLGSLSPAVGTLGFGASLALVDITRWTVSRRVKAGMRRLFQKTPKLPHRPIRQLQRAVQAGGAESDAAAGPTPTLHETVTSFAAAADELSFGQTRALMLDLVLSSGGLVYLLDEPFEGLSHIMRNLAVNAIRSHMASGAAAVIVDHDQDLIRSLCIKVFDLSVNGNA